MYKEEHVTVPDKGQSYLIAPNVNIWHIFQKHYKCIELDKADKVTNV